MVSGNPDPARMCTSHVERGNLSIRMGLRRFTRLTNAFSRKFENHEAVLGLYFAYWNFVQHHGTLKTTPAHAAGQEIVMNLVRRGWVFPREPVTPATHTMEASALAFPPTVRDRRCPCRT